MRSIYLVLEKIEKDLMKVSTTRSKHDIIMKKKNRGTKVIGILYENSRPL